MKTTEVVLRSIKDTLSWNVIKIALLTGVPLAIFWFGVAWFLWDPMLSFTGKFIGWVPFSILKANGAFLLGGFVWFAAVLTTFALIVSIFNMIIIRTLSPERYRVFSILLLLFIALAWTVFAFLHWDLVYSEVSKVLTWFPFQTLEKGVAAMLAALIFYNLFIVSLAVITLPFHKSFLQKLQLRDYPDTVMIDKHERVRFFTVILRDTAVFFGLLLVLFPLMFVPFVNILVQVFLWAWLIKEAYFLSVASLYATKEQVEQLRIHQFVLWGLAFIGSMLNLIPVINIFAPFFVQILFFHWVLLSKSKIIKS